MKPQNILIVFVFAAIGLCIFLFKDKIMGMLKPNGNSDNNNNTGTNKETVIEKIIYKDNPDVPNIIDIDKDLLLKKGSKGNEVKYLQGLINQALKVKKKSLLVAYGSFGQKTENALFFLIKQKQASVSKFVTVMIQTYGKGL